MQSVTPVQEIRENNKNEDSKSHHRIAEFTRIDGKVKLKKNKSLPNSASRRIGGGQTSLLLNAP